jgi:putative transposase/transposase-like zinc-binding protein
VARDSSNGPALEMADIVRAAGQSFLEQSSRCLIWSQVKVLRAIDHCRTAALGGHRDRCVDCDRRAFSYNSCRNRHCPKCQANARNRWLEARRQELLPVRYSHVVFTLPRYLSVLTLQNKKLIYHLLFRASAETLLDVARNPQHLGAEIGFFSVLHTWSQKLEHHPHVHCIVPFGGLAPGHQQWIHPRYSYFLPVEVLQDVFRAKFVEGLKRAHRRGELEFHGKLQCLAHPRTFAAWLRPLFSYNWVAYAKPPFGGPEHVLRYLGGYTHRIAISNHRLVSFADGQVTFRWRDRAHKNKKRLLTLPVEEFLRRFLLHVVPRGFVRIRFYGFLASRHRGRMLPLCRRLLGAQPEAPAAPAAPSTLWRCPHCGGAMVVVERLTAEELYHRYSDGRATVDTS